MLNTKLLSILFIVNKMVQFIYIHSAIYISFWYGICWSLPIRFKLLLIFNIFFRLKQFSFNNCPIFFNGTLLWAVWWVVPLLNNIYTVIFIPVHGKMAIMARTRIGLRFYVVLWIAANVFANTPLNYFSWFLVPLVMNGLLFILY